MMRVELDSICRLCVQIFEKEKVSPIFNNESYDKRVSLSERIKYCSAVEVTVDDGLPPQICSNCLLKLNESFVFRNQCVLADLTLKQLKDFGFNVDVIPNLSQIDTENQIINSDCLHTLYPSPEIKNGMKSRENIDEFDNSKNGRHKRNIHKLKNMTLQKRKTCNKKSEKGALNKDFEVSEDIENNLYSSPVILTFKNKKKNAKKNLDTNLSVQKKKKSKKLKNFLKIHDNHDEDLRNSNENCKMSFNELHDCKKMESISSDSNLEGISKNSNKTIVNSKCFMEKNEKKKKLLFTKEKPSSFKCDYCDKVYPSEGGWRYHIHTVHNENYQPFICDLCGQSFKVKKNLEAHKNSIHYHLKLNLCDICGRGFASKYSLKVHKSWHNDEKNFTCDVCGTKFRTRGKMNTHRSIHGGPKKFMCHICSRDFRWKKDFEIHMRTHTGEKPFKCSHCGKAFASLTNMKKHEKNHLKKENEISKGIPEAQDGKHRKNEILDFGYESEDVRNRQAGQVSGTTVYLFCLGQNH